MASLPADRFSPREVLRHFIETLPDSMSSLERAIDEVIQSSWDELARRRAHEMAENFAEASAISGFSDLAGVIRAIASLLKLRLEDTLLVQRALRDRLQELLGMLKELREKAGA